MTALSDEQVEAIRKKAGSITSIQLSKKYSVSLFCFKIGNNRGRIYENNNRFSHFVIMHNAV